jgi:hypothetical protein
MLHSSKFFDNVGQALAKYPNIDMSDMFSKGQIESKRWLIDKLIDLDLDLGTVFICAGWYGSLSMFLLETDLKIDKIRSFDIDDSCAEIAETFNRSWVMDDWKFKATTIDILEMTYPLVYATRKSDKSYEVMTDMPTTIINTSCEHIEKFSEWFEKIPDGTILALQTNNFNDLEEHVRISENIGDFSYTAPMSQTLYMGKLELPKYTRFMKIGIK